MKVGFTGTRDGMNDFQKQKFIECLQELCISEFHHGDCVGADSDAHDIIRTLYPSVKIVIHPPIENGQRAYKMGDEILLEYSYLERDRNIVDITEFLIGAPLVNDIKSFGGTWYTLRYAMKLTKPYVILGR